MSDRGELKEAFLAVVNTQPKDERLIAKNAERVVAARLRDARFFWESDRKTPLESRLERLHTVLFHKKLGSYRDKAERIEQLAAWIAGEVLGKPEAAGAAATAARLAKADLTTDMVFEFPELQGTMGGIYAREEGQPEPVWKAIYHQYLPVGVEHDAPPSRTDLGAAAVTWAALSLADKLDTVTGLLHAGERATGSRDPFGLRRQMHGIVRILMDLPELTGIEREIPVGLLAERARGPFEASPAVAGQVAAFAVERVRFALEQRGFAVAIVRAAASGADVAPLRARRLAEALQRTRTSEDFQALAVLFKRVKNIAKELAEVPALDRDALVEPAERALLEALDAKRPGIDLAAVTGGLHARVHRDRRAAPVGRPFFHRSIRHGRRRPREDRASDAHGQPAGSDSDARRHLGNRSSHGVGSRNGKEATGSQVINEEVVGQGRVCSEGEGRAEGQGVEEPETSEEARRYVYLFGSKTDGNGSMKPLLGGKGANLAEMCRIGLPVPPGFTITTEVCTYYYANKRTYPPTLRGEMERGIAALEQQTGKKFGDLKDPLLVSVRSGARDSMPGMMDTILNLGLNDQTVEALAAKTGNPRFAWDCYRRFVQMYCDVVLGVQKRPDEDHEPFETVIEDLKHERYHQDIEDTKLTVDDLKELVVRFKALVKERAGKQFPSSPWDQLLGAVGAVFGSWMNDRAIVYRRKYNIPTEWGTAVNVQAMVYGNTGDTSGSGVAFTRNPANGVKEFYGEFLINAQGEDVVAGVRTPEPVVRAEEADAEGLRRARAHPPDAREALQGRPGLRVHDRRGRRLHAADAQRQAHRDGGAEVLGGHVQGEADRLEDGGDAQSCRSTRAAAGAGVRRGGSGQGEGDRHGSARRAWRGIGSDLSERRPRRDGRRQGREGAAGPRRDVAGGSARHDRG